MIKAKHIMIKGDMMKQLLDEYKINNIKIINERIYTTIGENIIELLYKLFLISKDCDNYDNNKNK